MRRRTAHELHRRLRLQLPEHAVNQIQKHYLLELVNAQYENVRDGVIKPEVATRREEMDFIEELRKTLEAMDA